MKKTIILGLLTFLIVINLASSQISSFSKEDYLNISVIDNTIVKYELKNPEDKNLTFDELIRFDRAGNINFGVNIFEGGISSLYVYTYELVSVPIYELLPDNVTTESIILNGLSDVDKDTLSYVNGGDVRFINKNDLASYDLNIQTVTIYKLVSTITGSRLELQKVYFNTSDLILVSGDFKEVFMDFKPKIVPLKSGGWGYTIQVNPWFNTTFLNRRNITINNTASTENLIDFPILVVLNSSFINYSKTQDNGEDIRFTDSDESTILPHEIEVWNESGTSYVWVKVPQLDANVSTDFIQMYYNCVSCSDGQDATNVWDISYQAVYHMNQLNVTDSTSNNHDGIAGGPGNISLVQDSSDIVGLALNFSGGGGFINFSTFPITSWITEPGITLSTWIKELRNIQDISVLEFMQSSDDDRRAIMATQTFSQFDRPSFYGGREFEQRAFTLFDPDREDASYHSFIGRINSSNASLHVDNVIKDSENPGNFSTMVFDRFTIGASFGTVNSAGSVFGHFWNGTIDEVRISNISRSNSWLGAEYNTQINIMNSFGPEEDVPDNDTTPPQLSVINVSDVDNESAVVNLEADEDFNYSINYGITIALGTILNNASFANPHNATITGLLNNTQYFFNVTPEDSSGNSVVNGTFNFTTDQNTVGDTCTYPGSGTWTITDDCIIQDDTDVLDNLMDIQARVRNNATLTNVLGVINRAAASFTVIEAGGVN